MLKHQPKHQFAFASQPSNASKDGRMGLSGRPRTVDGIRLQYAALPYRAHNDLEFLLITSRETGRWVVPKGWPMKGKKPHTCAAREALEEAGIEGKIGKSAIGSYRYVKRLSNNASVPCIVDVYPLMVERQLERWREQGQRYLGWFSAAEASSLVDEGDLASLIEIFAAKLGQ